MCPREQEWESGEGSTQKLMELSCEMNAKSVSSGTWLIRAGEEAC